MPKLNTRRGAAGQQYAIIVGLIAVIAILAVTQMGSGVKSLMANTGNTLTNVVNGTVGSGGGSGGGGGGGCGVTRASCAAHYAAGCTTSGLFDVQPASTVVNVWCDMSLDGGGWTHALTVNANDGNSAGFADPIWSAATFGSNATRWNDYKNAVASDLSATAMLIVVRRAAAAAGATGPDLKGWRSWNLSPTRSLQTIFNLPVGAYNANAVGGCNTGYGGAGTLLTSGVKASGQCASYNDPTDGLAEDTFTCYATNVYANSYYGNCEVTGDAFRLSSWHRWSNDSNVGLGLQQNGGGNYARDVGTHMVWETYIEPGHYCSNNVTSCVNTYSNSATNISPGLDRGAHGGYIGENWRYEIYVK